MIKMKQKKLMAVLVSFPKEKKVSKIYYTLFSQFFTGDNKPLMSELHAKVINQYAAHWDELALKLGLANYLIKTISENNKFNPNRVKDCCIAVFEEWLERGDYSPTWGKLSNAIDEIEEGNDVSVPLKPGSYFNMRMNSVIYF